MKPSDVRALGKAFDALIRSIRMHGHAIPGAAERAFSVWIGLPGTAFEIAPMRITVFGHLALEASDSEGRWLLPAFMSGLRRLAPKVDMSAEDLGLVADAIARLESDVDSIGRFRDWLWSGAATGFDIELQHSFMEVLDDAPVDARGDGGIYEPAQAVSAVRTEVMRSISEQAVAISARVLAEAAMRDEFDLPLGTAAAAVDGSQFAIPATEAAEVRAACEDASRWALDETLLLLSHWALHEGARPERVAAAVIALVDADAHGAAAPLVDALTLLVRRSAPFARDLLRSLDRESFGDALALALLKSLDNAARYGEALLALGPVSSTRMAARLLDAAAREAPWFDALAGMMSASGGRLGPILLERVSVPTAHEVGVLVQLLGEGAVDALFARASLDAERWVGLSLGALCRAALELGRGAALIVPFVRDRGVPIEARLEALDIAQADDSIADELVAWKPAELLDLPAMRDRLRSLRESRKARR